MWMIPKADLPTLTEAQRQLLRDTEIRASEPGLIVLEFNKLLNFLAESPTPLTKSGKWALKVLNVLNEQLERPLAHGLQRPQQKSFPHLSGLFLLLRASGLTRVDAAGKTPLLDVDEAMVEQWQGAQRDGAVLHAARNVAPARR